MTPGAIRLLLVQSDPTPTMNRMQQRNTIPAPLPEGLTPLAAAAVMVADIAADSRVRTRGTVFSTATVPPLAAVLDGIFGGGWDIHLLHTIDSPRHVVEDIGVWEMFADDRTNPDPELGGLLVMSPSVPVLGAAHPEPIEGYLAVRFDAIVSRTITRAMDSMMSRDPRYTTRGWAQTTNPTTREDYLRAALIDHSIAAPTLVSLALACLDAATTSPAWTEPADRVLALTREQVTPHEAAQLDLLLALRA